MQSISAFSLAPAVTDWLSNSLEPRILHVFDHACNLINERREVLSVVTPQIGSGPFNLVVEEGVLFSEHIHAQSPISICSDQLTFGDLTIHIADAILWSTRPNWEGLHAKRENILDQLTKLPIINYLKRGGFDMSHEEHAGLLNHHQFSNSLVTSLSSVLANADISTAKTLACKLAGLGQGLTPSGDDFILGALYAAWIIHPHEVASVLAREVAETAAPLTTSLSAAWLRSAGRGEAGILWHNFFYALNTGDSSAIQSQITKLLSIGHTSGADSLAGFIDTIISYAESEAKLCPS